MPTPSKITTALTIEKLFFIVVHSRTGLINKPLSVTGGDVSTVTPSFGCQREKPQHAGIVPELATTRPESSDLLRTDEPRNPGCHMRELPVKLPIAELHVPLLR